MTTKVTADEDGERPQAAATRRDLPIASAVVRQDRGEGEGEKHEPTSQDATVADIPVAGPGIGGRRDADAETAAERVGDIAGDDAGTDDGKPTGEPVRPGEPEKARPAARSARTTRVDVKVIGAPETRLDTVAEAADASPADSEPAEEEPAEEEPAPAPASPAAESTTPAEPDQPAETAEAVESAEPADAAEPVVSAGAAAPAELSDATAVDPPVEAPARTLTETPVDAPDDPPVAAAAPVVPRPSAPLPSETMVEPLPAPPASSPSAPAAPQVQQVPQVPTPAVTRNWHRYHLAVGAFLLAYCAAGLIGTALGWQVRRGEIASYLDGTIGVGAGAATPTLIVIKVVEVFLTVVALAGVLRKKDVWYLPALTGWIAGFAVFCALDLWVGKTGRLIEHGIYLILFGALLFGSYALSVKVRVTRATAPGSGRPAATANLSRTQEIALAALERWQR